MTENENQRTRSNKNQVETVTLFVPYDLVETVATQKSYFGWHVDWVRSDRMSHGKLASILFFVNKRMVFRRTRSFPYKERIKELENQYLELEDQKDITQPVDVFNAIGLFLLGILPGILYLVIKNRRKKQVDAKNKAIERTQETLALEAQKILRESDQPYAPIPADPSLIQATGRSPVVFRAKPDPVKGKAPTIEVSASESNNAPLASAPSLKNEDDEDDSESD